MPLSSSLPLAIAEASSALTALEAARTRRGTAKALSALHGSGSSSAALSYCYCPLQRQHVKQTGRNQ